MALLGCLMHVACGEIETSGAFCGQWEQICTPLVGQSAKSVLTTFIYDGPSLLVRFSYAYLSLFSLSIDSNPWRLASINRQASCLQTTLAPPCTCQSKKRAHSSLLLLPRLYRSAHPFHCFNLKILSLHFFVFLGQLFG